MNHPKHHSILAVIVITILVLLYNALYFGLLIWLLPNLLVRIILGVVGVVFAIAMIVVCRQRLNEIKGGETDDLSKF